MSHLNVEIKARCADPEKIRSILKDRNAYFRGLDRQTDTYFNCRYGRLKLREGNIENSLIHYLRDNQAGPKDSHITLMKTEPGSLVKQILLNSLGELVTVRKEREIYFIENIKFHIDSVPGLGSFVEIEAIDETGEIGKEKLLRQCKEYMALFGITESDLLDRSYSDMLLEAGGAGN